MSDEIEAIRATLEKYGQTHLLKFVEELNDEEKSVLCDEIRSIDFDRLKSAFEDSLLMSKASEEKKDERLKPLPSEICGSTLKDCDLVPKWERLGMEAIGQNKVRERL